jgi:hypothetical protein
VKNCFNGVRWVPRGVHGLNVVLEVRGGDGAEVAPEVVKEVATGNVAVSKLGVFQVANVDTRNSVEDLATKGVVDRHVEAVDGHSAFVESVLLRYLRLRGARLRVGRGSTGDDERDVGEFRVRFGSEREGHVTMGPAAFKAGNGGCVGAELALGKEKRRIRGSGGVSGNGIEDFVRKVGNGEVGGRGHDGRGQDRGAVGQGWEQKDGWVAL